MISHTNRVEEITLIKKNTFFYLYCKIHLWHAIKYCLVSQTARNNELFYSESSTRVSLERNSQHTRLPVWSDFQIFFLSVRCSQNKNADVSRRKGNNTPGIRRKTGDCSYRTWLPASRTREQAGEGRIRGFSDIVQTTAVVYLLVSVQTDGQQTATAIYTKKQLHNLYRNLLKKGKMTSKEQGTVYSGGLFWWPTRSQFPSGYLKSWMLMKSHYKKMTVKGTLDQQEIEHNTNLCPSLFGGLL